MHIPAFIQPFLGEVRGVREGMSFLTRGLRLLRSHTRVYPYLLVPILVNAILFVVFVMGGYTLLARFFGNGFPDSWWGIAVYVIAFAASVVALVFLGTSLFAFAGSIVCAPFYEYLATELTRSFGGIVIDRPWWEQWRSSFVRSMKKWWWYMLIQIGLLILYIVPFAFGPVAYSVFGFFVTAFFLAWEYLDMSFDFGGLSFAQRRRWCLRNKGLLFGFGTAIFIGFAIPLVNIFIPLLAVAGSVALFHEHDGVY